MLFPSLAQAIKDALSWGDLIGLRLEPQRKAFTEPPFWAREDSYDLHGLLPRTKVDFAREVGDGLGSSVLMGPVKWVQRTFPEAPIEIVRKRKADTEVLADHPLAQLLAQPNPHYTGTDLWKGTLFSYIFDGNGYWLKSREADRAGTPWWQNVTGRVERLWYVPHWLMEPTAPQGSGEFITHYRYRVNGQFVNVHPRNVVHFRNGLDPRNPRKGLSQVQSEFREIFGDDEAANFVAALLRNHGVPGIVLSPEPNSEMVIAVEDMESVKQYLKQQFTGDKRGEPLALRGPTRVQEFGFDPKKMDLSAVRDVAEERLCAAIGIPAAVVGFGTGLQQTKVGATLLELVSLAWKGCLVPMQNEMAQTVRLHLLTEFEPRIAEYFARFDHTQVWALQRNRNELAQELTAAVQGMWMKRSEARQAWGLEVGPEDEVYLQNISVIETTGDEPMPPPQKQIKSVRELRLLGKATAREEQIILTAREGRPTRDQNRLIRQLNRDALTLSETFESDLEQFFARMGSAIAEAALDVLEPGRPKAAADELTATSILSRIEIETLVRELGQIGGAHYLRVAKQTLKALDTVMGLAVDLPDERGREIVAMGGRRMGLIDLSEQTRKRLFRELAAGREAGEGPVELARRIREFVPAGRWGSVASRSRTIARTETLHAQRLSTLEAYRDAPTVTEVMVFDGRLATSDDDCIALDGKIVSIEEAWQLMQDEHPNGSRNFAPVIGETR